MTPDVVNEFFHRHYPSDLSPEEFEFDGMVGGMWRYTGSFDATIFPRMVCADGFSMSVQGHAGAYSIPRSDFADFYVKVEVGFPSAREELLMEYAEDSDQPTETVYGYVPISTVARVIEANGGLVDRPAEASP